MLFRSETAFVWALGSQEVIAVGTVRDTHPREEGMQKDVSLFDQALLMDSPEKGKWGSYSGLMTRGQFRCPFSLIAVLLFQAKFWLSSLGKWPFTHLPS